MNIQYFENTEMMSQKAADFVLDEVYHKPDLLICTATGNSPKLLYKNLAKNSSLFSKTRIMPLDEWIGLPTLEGSCKSYIKEYILEPLQIPEERYFGFNKSVERLEKECERIQVVLKREGPIDVCILGLGKNGHLGFNEPANELKEHCHIAILAQQSQGHEMVKDTGAKLTRGLTLGMSDILSAQKIILLVSGEEKEEVTRQLVSGTVTNNCPATWLWKHENVECLIVN